MKKLSFVFAGLALVASAAFTSCEKDPAPGADEGLKSIALSINFGGVATKAVDDDLEAGFATGNNYTSLQIYFTDDEGNINYAYNAKADSQDDDGKTIWANLTNASNGVKFIGLESVSGVYVTANAELKSGITYGGPVTGIKVSAINDLLKIENIDGVAANMMPYAGACTQLQTAGSSISGTAGEVIVGDGADGAEYLVADLTIRPAVSRFEVSKVGVKTEGTTYFKEVTKEGVKILEPCAVSDQDVKYSVAWSGFDAELIGIYMSNFYQESPLFPNKTAIRDWTTSLFATPGFEEGTSPISGGKWTALSIDNAGISYANYNNGYEAFTTENVGNTTGNPKYLFDGTTNSVVVPFNFFVPYSLTDKGATAEAVASFNDVVSPALHFQFRKPTTLNITYTSIQENTTGSWQDVTDDNLKQQLENAVAWPNSTDAEGIVYANVTKFLTTDGDESSAITIKPGLIYKIHDVIVEPVNLSVSTKLTDQFNVYVVVEVVGFDVKNVYPSFD
ncbi:MAG TPA: hypothetical protein IAC86_07330 [Candidatus Cryptobacteroides excrementigallinarum]|nr:hypothetical protein [Candidatus Cryptobacteroides excrementigallinarum]